MKQYSYTYRTYPATPRNGRILDGMQRVSSAGASISVGIGSSVAQYWQLITQDEEGNDLGEGNYFLLPVDEVAIASPKDVVAYATAAPVEGFPIATYDQLGIIRIKQGCGLTIEDGVLSIDEGAIGGGFDETQLEEYLTIHKYMKEGDGLTLSSKLTGYAIGESYTPLSADDTILSAFGKLEKNFDSYVDTYSNQTVGGIKTFEQTIYGNQDVVCYATGTVTTTLPIASSSQLGIVKIGSNLSVDANGVLSANEQAGGLTSCSPYDSTSGFVSSIVYNSIYKSLTYYCTTPKTLSWSYGSVTSASNGSYNALSDVSFVIPNNTSHLTNGAGYINTIGSDQNKTYTSGTGNVVYAVSKDNTYSNKINYYYYNRRFFESQELNTQINLTSTNGNGGIKFYRDTDKTRLRIGPGNGIKGYAVDVNTGNEVDGRVYINWESDKDYVQFDESHNIAATGDIVAFATKSVVANTPVATTAQLGLVRVKSGGGIAIDSNGYLTCTVSGGGDSPITSVTVSTLSAGSNATASYSNGVLSLGIPSGKTGPAGVTEVAATTLAAGSNATATLSGTKLTLGIPRGNTGSTGVTSVKANTLAAGSNASATLSGTTLTLGIPRGANGSDGANWPAYTKDNVTYSKNNYGIWLENNSYARVAMQLGGSTWHRWVIANSSSTMTIYYNYSKAPSDFNTTATSLNGSSGEWTPKSDERLKNIECTLDNVLENIAKMNVFYYRWRSNPEGSREIGMGALSVKSVYPELVSEIPDENGNSSGYYGLAYARIGVIALQACKELHSLHKSLTTRVSTIEKWRISTDAYKDALTKRVEALEQMVNNKTA